MMNHRRSSILSEGVNHSAVEQRSARGYVDKVETAQVTRYEAAMLGELRARQPQLLEAIRSKRELSADLEKELAGFLDDFARTFV